MKVRLLVVVLVLGLLGFLGLLAIQWQFGLGRFAESPQTVTVTVGVRAIVGGGRAVVGLVEADDDAATFEVACAAGEESFELARETVSDEVCGVRLRWLGPAAENPGAARFEVTWD